MQPIEEILYSVGDILEVEKDRDPSTWIRYPRIDRLRALLRAETAIWALVREALPRTRLEVLAFERAASYITHATYTLTEGYPTTVTLTGRQNTIALLTAHVNGFHADILTEAELRVRMQSDNTMPRFQTPAVVLAGAEVHVYPMGIDGTLDITALTRGPWYDRSKGGVSIPGGDVRELTDTSRSWDDDQFNGGTIIIDDSLYTVTDTTETKLTFTAAPLTTDTYGYSVLAEFAELSDEHLDLLSLFTALELLGNDDEAPGYERIKLRSKDALYAFAGIEIEEKKKGK